MKVDLKEETIATILNALEEVQLDVPKNKRDSYIYAFDELVYEYGLAVTEEE